MKTKAILFFLSAIFLIALQGCGIGYMSNSGSTGNEIQTNENQDNYVDQQYNVDDLNQYGDWENVDSYGRVWRPSVNPGWQPFVNGHWSYDGYDWVWVSYEPFGWMVYHYGSWEYTPDYGWVWIPEQDAWSPACVDWIYYDDQVGWAPRRAHNRNWSDPWNQDNMHPWVVVRMEDFDRENVVSYRMNNIPGVRNDQSARIERRQPDVKTVQAHVKEPIQTVKIEREPVQRNPVRNDVTPPVERNPVRTEVTPPVERNPVRTEVTPPVERNPVRTEVTPPVGRNPVRTEVTPPVERNPVRTEVTPPVVRNQNIVPQNTRPIYHMQIPPQEKQKVDRYQPNVVNNSLRKKAPVNNDNKTNKPQSNTKQKSGPGEK